MSHLRKMKVVLKTPATCSKLMGCEKHKSSQPVTRCGKSCRVLSFGEKISACGGRHSMKQRNKTRVTDLLHSESFGVTGPLRS